ncbi:helix-turn-helix transcriptional regulator [Rhizobium sp. CF142]|uniref:helix-turn-helix transcriptional regulator n=1 Tax=Rhizobium sp. CF142 TaxID=1144314 RepID=UPI00026EF3B5|nr:PAS and helix-turn-helix domain-containing protein [Rhizobium sp. CF142]EJJ24766.1 response regulator containing a CheY-like receiver domain and an HTH DNA-binding domain [Rhizobium sp. CF142]
MEHADIVDAIYRASVNIQLWSSTLCAVVDYVGATAGNIVYQAPDGKSSFLIPGRMREDLNDLYLQHYAGNPYAKAFEKVQPDQVAIGNELIDDAAVRRTAYYADICAPQNIYNQLFVPHASLHERGGIGGVALFLSKAQDAENTQAARKLLQLTPHLSRSIELSLHVGSIRREASLLQRLLEALPDAAMLLDSQGEIVLLNSAAEDILRRGDGLSINRHERSALPSISSSSKALAHAIRQAIEIASGTATQLQGAVQILRPSGQPPYLAQVTPLPPNSFVAWDSADSGARVLLQIVDAESRATGQAEQLRNIFSLTAAETKVAVFVGCGFSVPETARMLALSPNTVKTHTARLLSKTGVRSQAAFARLMASVPAWPGQP